ncbi:MAG TPA: DUF4276 family protein [Bryobacteraceae bacterium]|nr:DUF4276 family protein [Bryobacteraceae bacterium]
MSKTEIFFEGNPSLKLPLLTFIEKAVPGARDRIRVRLGKNKEETIKDFLRAMAETPKVRLVLLVDSDLPDDGTLFNKLKETTVWKKHASGTIAADRVNWMVQIMEAWFVVDEPALKSYYAKTFRSKALPKRKNVELVPKSEVLDGLKRASNGKYDKVAHAPKILDRLTPETVRARAPNCDRFLKFVAK